MFTIKTNYKPSGDQPKAIQKLLDGFQNNMKEQILLGATGTGKTFTIANIIQKLNKKTLIIAHNKTLAGQLYNEFKEIFPDNKVEYFISYYDYYQPEAYIIKNDTYIGKEASINNEIDKLRHRTIESLINNTHVIVVASVSCIYGIGDIENYKKNCLYCKINEHMERNTLIKKLVKLQYQRNNISFQRGNFRVRGDIIEIITISQEQKGIRIIFDENTIQKIQIFNISNGKIITEKNCITILPASLYNIDQNKLKKSVHKIEKELKQQIRYFKKQNKLLEIQRIENKTKYDLEMLIELGYCNGVENYCRYLSLQKKNQPLSTLMDFFDKDYLTIIDESHVTIPQIKSMYFGNLSRKQNLIQYGFRLPSALDNRPLTLKEFEHKTDKVIYLSATPGEYELSKNIPIIEQLIRPTFLLDPKIKVQKTKNQIDNIYFEIKKRIKLKEKVLISTLTITMSEELTNYLKTLNIKVCFLHSKIKTLERLKILQDLRSGQYDCLVGVNLLREGLDLPEVSLMIILDADKTGFLRNERSLIQTIGRVARNKNGEVIMYSDRISIPMQNAIQETNRRRKIQEEFNQKNQTIPTNITKKIQQNIYSTISDKNNKNNIWTPNKNLKVPNQQKEIQKLEKLMKKEAKKLNFEKAIELRNLIKKIKKNHIKTT